LKYDFGWSVADNGNVNGITNNRDTTRSQSFTYDLLLQQLRRDREADEAEGFFEVMT
jgi:hypothetical protein